MTQRDQDRETPATDPIASLRDAMRGRYEIERQIGQGAFATVYLARDLKHERKVAIKVLNADPESETGEIRFIREIRLVARLQHPNILPLHDSGHVGNQLYYVMPYVMGETLRMRMHRERQMGIDASCAIAREAADALAYAHGQGIVHRDIKPENILLSGGHAIVADFGIARAIDLAGVKQLTATGMGGPGTPAYMSPEQLLGDRAVDARSDIYSLGCVLYEMLAGKPPFPGKDGFVKRFTEPPPHISSLRRDIAPWLDEVVAIALSKDPSDRYASASDLVTALCPPTQTVRTPRREQALKHPLASPPLFAADPLESQEIAKAFRTPAAAAPEPMISSPPADRKSVIVRWVHAARANPRRAGISALAIVAVSAAVGTASRELGFPADLPVDANRFVVLPFADASGAARGTGSRVSDQLYDALAQWEGMSLVSDTRVAETIAESGRLPAGERQALSLARRLGAGKLVWGQAIGGPGSARVRAHVYDVQARESTTEVLFVDSASDARTYASAAAMLLKVPGRPSAADGGDGLTRSYPSWAAYGRGHVALSRWNLFEAEREFREAVRADPSFGPARLWLGQVLAWQRPSTPGVWRENAERAAAASPRMIERDRRLSVALAAMAGKQYPAACEAYRAVTRIDSLDFVGWYGLGECQSLDPVVLSDPSSPSGFRWRSSYDAAVKAFARATRVEPSAHILLSFERLRRLLPTAGIHVRLDDRSNPSFAAFPSLSADTIAFVPYPVGVFAKGLPAHATSTLNQALNRNAETLYELTTNWVRVFPQSPDAHESLADVLETRGNIFGNPQTSGSAMAAVNQALSLSTNPQQRLRLAVRSAGLRFKRGDFAGVRSIADSLVSLRNLVDRNEPPVLITLTALTGRVNATAGLAKSAVLPEKIDGVAVPVPLAESAADLFANAAMGVCGDTLAKLRSRVEQEIESSVPEQQRPRVRAALTTRALSMMVPCTQGASALELDRPSSPLYRLQQAFARKDTVSVRRRLLEVAAAQRALRPTDLSTDYIFHESWVRAAIGDTLGAISRLDRSLNSIATWSAPAWREPGASAAVGRAMALRAELAARTGDRHTARRWAKAVADLWASADPPLQRVISQLNALAPVAR